MLQGIVGLDAALGVIVQHPEDQVLELQVVGNSVARLPGPSATWTPCLHTQDGVELPRGWRLILLGGWSEGLEGGHSRQRLRDLAECDTNHLGFNGAEMWRR